MQLVVVMAVRKAVSAATITFTATSTIFFFIRYSLFLRSFSNGAGVTHGDWLYVLSVMAQCVPVPLCVTSKA